jgi:hypothetical protein
MLKAIAAKDKRMVRSDISNCNPQQKRSMNVKRAAKLVNLGRSAC